MAIATVFLSFFLSLFLHIPAMYCYCLRRTACKNSQPYLAGATYVVVPYTMFSTVVADTVEAPILWQTSSLGQPNTSPVGQWAMGTLSILQAVERVERLPFLLLRQTQQEYGFLADTRRLIGIRFSLWHSLDAPLKRVLNCIRAHLDYLIQPCDIGRVDA